MSSLKDMYRTVLKDTFPDTMTITLGDACLLYTSHLRLQRRVMFQTTTGFLSSEN